MDCLNLFSLALEKNPFFKFLFPEYFQKILRKVIENCIIIILTFSDSTIASKGVGQKLEHYTKIVPKLRT